MSKFVPGCDAVDAPIYIVSMADGVATYGCRCIVCSRCGHHTGNSNQGHYWAWCKVSAQREGFHHCCPGNCEINASAS